MPPIRKKDPLKSAQIEGKIQLAISDLKNGRISNIREATRIYEIPRTTLRDRLKGIEYKGEKRANNHKLTQFEEESLVKWVLDLDRRGFPPGILSYEKWLIICFYNMEINRLERNGYIISFNVVQKLNRSSHEDITTNVLNAKSEDNSRTF
jgi:hypothetical protein